jgi:hypothetical protein
MPIMTTRSEAEKIMARFQEPCPYDSLDDWDGCREPVAFVCRECLEARCAKHAGSDRFAVCHCDNGA